MQICLKLVYSGCKGKIKMREESILKHHKKVYFLHGICGVPLVNHPILLTVCTIYTYILGQGYCCRNIQTLVPVILGLDPSDLRAYIQKQQSWATSELCSRDSGNSHPSLRWIISIASLLLSTQIPFRSCFKVLHVCLHKNGCRIKRQWDSQMKTTL